MFVFIFRYTHAAFSGTRGLLMVNSFVVYSSCNKNRAISEGSYLCRTPELVHYNDIADSETLNSRPKWSFFHLLSISFWLTLINCNALAHILSVLEAIDRHSFWNVGCSCTEYN